MKRNYKHWVGDYAKNKSKQPKTYTIYKHTEKECKYQKKKNQTQVLILDYICRNDNQEIYPILVK